MSARENSVTAEKTIASTISYSNRNDAGREFDITANVSTGNGRVDAFQSGSVTTIDGSRIVADFNSHNAGQLNLNLFGYKDMDVNAVVNDIIGFMADVAENVESTKG